MRGFGSVIGVLLAAIIAVVLIVFYLKSSMPQPAELQQQHGAIDRAREQAQSAEKQQQKHFQELDEAAR